MSEPAGKYDTGRPQENIEPARLLEMLQMARAVMRHKADRHARKMVRPATKHDREFHKREVAATEEWIRDCDLVIRLMEKALAEGVGDVTAASAG